MKFSDINLLRELEKEECAPILAAFSKRSHPKGKIVFRPDSRENQVFIVASGRLRLYLAYAEREFTLSILDPGDIYASHTGAYVEALEPVQLYVADVDIVSSGLADVPHFTKTMVRVLGHILRNAFAIIGNLALKDSFERICDFFAREAAQGEPHKGGVLIKPGLTVEQIAQMLGLTRQTVSTVIGQMIRDGLVEKRGRGNYFLPYPESLAHYASD